MNTPLSSPIVMGIVNITPDSFSDGGHFIHPQKAISHIQAMLEAGATMIDIGAESSRPGATPLSIAEEINRLDPVLSAIKAAKIGTTVSIDTYKPEVAKYCLEHYQVDIINDITGLRDPQMTNIIAKHQAGIIIMHMKGTPKTMQIKPTYRNIIEEIYAFLEERCTQAHTAGIQNIIVDPGIGFGKSTTDNFTIIRELSEFKSLGYPILIGASRKSCIGNLTGAAIKDRLPGTLALHLKAKEHGARILRVHDVAEHVQALKVWDYINSGSCVTRLASGST
jgi:dihydropteroate synthase